MKNGLLVLLSLVSLNSFACPLGPKEDHLNIHRVMRNFGKYSSDAEMSILEGINNPTYVKEAKLDKGISDLDIVISCADAVIANPTGDLLPSMGQDLKGAELEEYIAKLRKYFTEFKNVTLELQRLLKVEKAKPIEQRDYKPLYTYDKEVFDAVINEAHRELQ